ncbi:hypothetical protein SAMCFNEI73_Ch0711 [Sinorhizobium americanum]|uniref:Uncharacterized protein n=1 Tax=Sinorhizobium americanum TaxID=194963 RepID=A0A1L3LJ06_9HYPH|nr:hypothetical protein SAMCFNEI73_Ch0711 [Sinorhizobium americanum]
MQGEGNSCTLADLCCLLGNASLGRHNSPDSASDSPHHSRPLPIGYCMSVNRMRFTDKAFSLPNCRSDPSCFCKTPGAAVLRD